VLKDLITYFRDLHKSYEVRSKTLSSASNIISNSSIPSNFLTSGGLGDATVILRDFHKQATSEANKAKDLENEVIMQLTGLRSDLQQKIKEIKSLSGDFKNSVDKEQDQTRKAVKAYQEALGLVDHDPSATSGKGDPYIVKMNVDKQVERQIDEENYLHRVRSHWSYVNNCANHDRRTSIWKPQVASWSPSLWVRYRKHTLFWPASCGAKLTTLTTLRRSCAKGLWQLVKTWNGRPSSPAITRWWTQETLCARLSTSRIRAKTILPHSKSGAACSSARASTSRTTLLAGMWISFCSLVVLTRPRYILSPTHLHEFKSADRLASQSPVMSLYLPEQKLGTHSEPGSSSHKFMLKGRQSGSMHRGHSWVFRAETYDTMIAWFNDVKELTEKTGEARNDFVRRTHARSMSGSSLKAPSIGGSSEGGLEDDEADRQAFAGEQSVRGNSIADGMPMAAGFVDDRSEAGWQPQKRPSPGGRFPSDLNVQRGLQAPVSPSSGGSSDRDAIANASALPGSAIPFANTQEKHAELPQPSAPAGQHYAPGTHPNIFPTHVTGTENQSQYGDWMAPMAAGVGGAAIGAGAALHHNHNKEAEEPVGPVIENIDNSERQMDAASPGVPEYGTSSPPIPVVAPIVVPTTAPSFAPTTSTNTDANTISTQTTAPTEYSSRPAMSKVPTGKSVQTISDLHVPGEFPKASNPSPTAA
jgi:hypothetical protein